MTTITIAPRATFSAPRPLSADELSLLRRAWERWGEAGALLVLRELTGDAWAYRPGRFTIVRRRAA
jgi:hypothetical protein